MARVDLSQKMTLFVRAKTVARPQPWWLCCASYLRAAARLRSKTLGRTRLLFYVTCRRSEISQAIVYYSLDLASARGTICQYGWFETGEAELID